MLNSFRSDELVKVQGKTYPVVGGRLRLAHDENKALSIETNVVHYTEDTAVVQATVRTEKGNFTGLGNASVKRDRILSNAILELAETRAIARALRFAGYGVEYTGFEEVGDAKNLTSGDLEQHDMEGDATAPAATKAQLNTIFSIARSMNMTNDELKEFIQQQTGKSTSKELSKRDASQIISLLKERETVQSTSDKLM